MGLGGKCFVDEKSRDSFLRAIARQLAVDDLVRVKSLFIVISDNTIFGARAPWTGIARLFWRTELVSIALSSWKGGPTSNPSSFGRRSQE